MPRPSNALGRPGTPVIPMNWEAAHAPVAAKTHTGTCQIHAPASTPTIGDDLSYEAPTEPTTPLYDGGCRIQKLTVGDAMTTLGDQALVRTRYLVSLDRVAAGIPVGAVVDITNSNDPDLNAGTLTVAQTTGGTLRFERDLICVISEGV